MAKPYNGFPSWNQWNVSLWINNDEGLYRWAYSLVSEHGVNKAAHIMCESLLGETTPDGGRYNYTAIRGAIREIL